MDKILLSLLKIMQPNRPIPSIQPYYRGYELFGPVATEGPIEISIPSRSTEQIGRFYPPGSRSPTSTRQYLKPFEVRKIRSDPELRAERLLNSAYLLPKNSLIKRYILLSLDSDEVITNSTLLLADIYEYIYENELVQGNKIVIDNLLSSITRIPRRRRLDKSDSTVIMIRDEIKDNGKELEEDEYQDSIPRVLRDWDDIRDTMSEAERVIAYYRRQI